jgi:non-heme chloroperoxidase
MPLTHAQPFPAAASHMLAGPNGMTVYTRCLGEDHHPTLLFTHGGLQSSRSFRKQALALSLHFRVVLWDLPYHGRSGPHEPASERMPITAHLWAQAMQTVVDAYHLSDTGFVQVAWSFGGLVTHNYLLTCGSRGLHGLVLVASHLDFEDLFQQPQVAATQRQVQALWQEGPSADPASLSALLRWQGLLTASRPEPEDDYETLGYNTLAWIRLRSQGAQWGQTQMPGDTQALLSCLPFSVLLIHGARDALIPLSEAQQFAARIKGAHLRVYEQCGHSPFLEDPNRFNQDLIDFVQSSCQPRLAH